MFESGSSELNLDVFLNGVNMVQAMFDYRKVYASQISGVLSIILKMTSGEAWILILGWWEPYFRSARA